MKNSTKQMMSSKTAVSSLTILMVATFCASSAYAETEFDYETCLPPKPFFGQSSDASGLKKFTVGDLTDESKRGLLGATISGDPLNISMALFDSVDVFTPVGFNEAEATEETLRGGSINLTSGTANSRVSISGQQAISNGNGDATYFTLELSAPAAKSGDSEIARLGEFASDAQLKFSLFKTFGSWKVSPLKVTDRQRIQNEIVAGIKASKACDADCQSKLNGINTSQVVLTTNCIKEFAPDGGAKNSNLNSFTNQYDRTASTFFGGSASIGYKEFEFKDLSQDKDVSDNKTPWSLDVFAGRYSASRKTLFRAGYTYVEDYKASDEITLCAAAEDDAMGTQQCESLRTSGPKDDQKDVAYVEMRQQFGDGLVRAATVKLSYDFDDKETEIDAPIYLISDSEKNLNGGVRLGWSESEDIKFGIFVGSTFSLSGS